MIFILTYQKLLKVNIDLIYYSEHFINAKDLESKFSYPIILIYYNSN